MTLLRRVLNHRVSVEAVLEAALWALLPYVVVGLVWAFFHPELVGHLEAQLHRLFPAGSEIVAMGVVAGLWPILMAAPNVCMY
ncbi:hypothetical protein [Mycolicibacterium thermoresistibile]